MFEVLELEETVGKLWHRLVGSTSSMPRYPEHGVSFDEVKPFLATCFRGFGGDPSLQLGPAHSTTAGHRLRFRQLVGLGEEKIAIASKNDVAALVPPVVDLFPDRHRNRDLYVWLAAYMAVMPNQSASLADPLQRDILSLEYALQNVGRALSAFPGLTLHYHALCSAVLILRSRGALPPVERLVESRIIAMLSEGAGLPHGIPPAIFPQKAPAGYQSMLVVPLWPQFEYRAENPKGGAIEEHEDIPARDTMEAAARLQANREAQEERRERSPFILNRFEKILAMSEKVDVDRPTDDKDETQNDAARDLDEITLGKRKERPSSKFRFDLDLPPEAVGPGTVRGQFTYHEWNYRKGEYMPSYCNVVCGEAGVEENVPPLSDEQRALSRAVRRQFEVLRPRREVLRAQLDGAELDLDAVVRMRADLAASGEANDRIHLASRPRGHDLAVTVLVDVSLSTDAWFDNQRVLDVEKAALSVLANGLAACGTHNSILTFTSRRNSWVRVETVKEFTEPMSETVERRIASLRPGYYTRIGAAIRHASALIGKQPNKKKLLLVLSDGKPNDVDHYEGRFALEDSKKAVMEARRSGVSVFAVTVDRDAKSYLPAMFGQNGYAIVGDIRKLPRALPGIYRGLTR